LHMEGTVDKFPVGKLPVDVLERMLQRAAGDDDRLILGPGVGLDCAVIEFDGGYLVAKSDPITFATKDIGWYAVHINANDIATTGALPRWFMATLLLPEQQTDEALVSSIFEQVEGACRVVGATLVGGHTEISAGLGRPIVIGTMLGEVSRQHLVTPRGARPGNRILLTKGIPIEAASLLAREVPDKLGGVPDIVVERARTLLTDPGISVLPEAAAATAEGGVTAMHDPTEGGLAGGLWELSLAAGVGIEVERQAIYIVPAALAICTVLNVDPLAAIASGALLIAVEQNRADDVMRAIRAKGIDVANIGVVTRGSGVAIRDMGRLVPLPRPERDAVASVLEEAWNAGADQTT
jgi:hydrogenase expression/formation protein HypE